MSELRKQQHKFSSRKEAKVQQRREVNVQLRKNAREEQMQKRRNLEDVNTSPLKSPNKDSTASPLRNVSNVRNIELGDCNLPLRKVLELINSPIQKDQLIAVTATRKLLSKDDRPPVEKVIKAGLIPVLVEKLDSPSRQMRFEACWGLTNIASGTAEQTFAVYEAGAIPKMVRLLSEQDDELVDQAVWAIGNIAGDGATLRDAVLKCGTVPGIMCHIRSDKKITHLRNMTWMISNLCRNKPSPSIELIQPLLEPLNALVSFDDIPIQVDASWALSYITDSSDKHAEAVCNTNGMIDTLMRHLGGANDDKLITPALRAVGNIITGNDKQTQFCLDKGFLACVASLMNHRKNSIVKETCWALSNVTAGTRMQVNNVITYGLVPMVIKQLKSNDFKIQKEAAWAVVNLATTRRIEVIEHCVDNDAISGLAHILGCNDNVINVCILEGISNMLETANGAGNDIYEKYATLVEESGALDKIETLQECENEDVYKNACHIIETYFSDDQVDEGPNVNPDGYFQFNVDNSQQNTFTF